MTSTESLKSHLNALVEHFETPAFIPTDPVAIPHGFSCPRDREVIGLYAALLAWGRRETVLKKMHELCERMRYQPYRFVRQFDPLTDGAQLDGFLHRTFQPEDAISITEALSIGLQRHETVENLFAQHMTAGDDTVENGIQGFSEQIMTLAPETPPRLQKHLARPNSGSSCKRLNMYLRWMVRPGPVDFGIWKKIRPAQLVLPVDIHAGRQARNFGLLTRSRDDWKAALELTYACRRYSPQDPARYDYAFFGLGVYGRPSSINGTEMDGDRRVQNDELIRSAKSSGV